MDILNAVATFEIAGNKLWRIIALFGIILIAFIIGKIAKFILQKSATKVEIQQRPITATTLNAAARGVIFLFAACGISLSLLFLELKLKVAEVSQTLSAILLSMGIGYFLYWLAEIPGIWFAKMAVKTESKLDDMLVPVIRKSLRVTIIILVLVALAATGCTNKGLVGPSPGAESEVVSTCVTCHTDKDTLKEQATTEETAKSKATTGEG